MSLNTVKNYSAYSKLIELLYQECPIITKYILFDKIKVSNRDLKLITQLSTKKFLDIKICEEDMLPSKKELRFWINELQKIDIEKIELYQETLKLLNKSVGNPH